MGNIGRVTRRIELEPIPDDIPCPEIVPEREPVKVPASTGEFLDAPEELGWLRSRPLR